jgi:hypothetical protein
MMNRILIALIAMFMVNSSCAQAQKKENKSPKILVAYYSWGGWQANLFKDIAKFFSNATMKKGIAVDGTSVRQAKSDVKKWLQELEIIK